MSSSNIQQYQNQQQKKHQNTKQNKKQAFYGFPCLWKENVLGQLNGRTDVESQWSQRWQYMCPSM